MLQPSRRRSTLSQSAAVRRASLSSTLPAPRTQATSATAAGRGGDDAGVVAGVVSPGPKSRPLAALRPVPSSLPPPPPRSWTQADDISASSSTSAGGDGSGGDYGSTVMRTAASGGVYRSQVSAFLRPPPIDTSSLVGARGPSSPPPRGKYTSPLTPSPCGETHGSRTDRDESEEGKENKRFMKALATEAAAVITMGTLNPTNLHSGTRAAEGEFSSTPGGGGGGAGGSSTSSYRSDSDSKNKALSLPFRRLIAHHAPSVADRHPSGRPSSPQARVGAVRRGSGCDGVPLTGIRRRGSGSGIGAENIRPPVDDHHPAGRPSSPRARAGAERRGSGCDGVPLTGIRRRGSGSGINTEIAGDGARWARGKHLNGVRQGSQSGEGGSETRRGSGGGGSGVRWANGKPLTGGLRRGSGDATDTVVGDGIRWASSKPTINTRSNATRSADSYRSGPDIPKAIASDALAAENEYASEGSRSFRRTDPRRNAARKSSYTATADAGHLEQGREGTASPTRALARATARRLSALGAKAIGGMSLGGTNISSDGPGLTATTRPPPPPTASGTSTGSGSPGAKGEGPPPPLSREQRRRMSAAPLTEQQLQGATGSRRGHVAPAVVHAA